MTLFVKLITTAIVAGLLLVGGIKTGESLQPQSTQSAQSFGATFTPVGGQTYTLSGAGITQTQTTVPLTSFTTPDGRAITMAMVGSIGYGTLEPNTTAKIEDITFTGVTQNSNGTAILTGVSRGTDFVSPYAASSTLAKSHAGGSYFILSNTAGFYGQQFLFANNPASSTATLTFSPTAPPFYYPSVGAQATGGVNATTSEFASVAYVNQVAFSGVNNATTLIKGIIQLATAAQAALGTALGSTGASLVLPASLATSTPGVQVLNVIPVTGTNEKLAQSFLDLTANWTFSTTTAYTTNIGTLTATTSARLPANTTIGGLTPLFTTTIPRYTATSFGSFSGTSSVLSIPAGVFTASSTIYVSADTSCSGGSSPICRYYLRDALTNKTLDVCAFTGISGGMSGPLTMTVANQSSLSSQMGTCNGIATNGSTASIDMAGNSTSALNTANAVNLVLVANLEGGSGSLLMSNYSIVVTP